MNKNNIYILWEFSRAFGYFVNLKGAKMNSRGDYRAIDLTDKLSLFKYRTVSHFYFFEHMLFIHG